MGEPRTAWERFEHGADIGIRGFGRTKAEAFEQAANALVAVIGEAQPASEPPLLITLEAPDDTLLLVDFLNELLFEMTTRGWLFHRVHVTLDGHRLHASAHGGPVRFTPETAGVEVKGATYTASAVSQRADGSWLAQCVVDV
ncbi:MAG: archease [Geminicoccaceae bacterium]|nr:MAG: archease [Geminicoccaceae bacterium]